MRSHRGRWTLQRKTEIRHFMRKLCSLVSADYRAQASVAAAAHFVHSAWFDHSQHIGIYAARPQELNTLPMIQALQEHGKYCYLPIVAADPQDKKLSFARYHPETLLTPNRFQIPEPPADELIPAEALQLVMMPLLAFDDKGIRLGSGGGFYDVTFSFLKKIKKKQRPLLIGLGYEIQHVTQLPQEDFDVPLDGIITEEKIRLFDQQH